jgi:hypothetical protein
MAQSMTAKARYEGLVSRRDPFLRRARAFAALTIPSLLPPEGHTSTQELPETYQSFGARCVTSLSSRLMTSFIPPGQKGFKLQVPAEVLLKAGKESAGKDAERGLSLSENVVESEMNARGWRQTTYLLFQHLIITGNVLEQTMSDNTLRLFRLDQYVVVRDPQGSLIEFVVQEHLSPDALPPNLANLVDENEKRDGSTIPLYTWGKWDPEKRVWVIFQEIADTEVPDSRGEYQLNPFRALRWVPVVGEDYGRAKVEEHYGDFLSLEGLSKSVVDGAAMASRNIVAIRPNAAGGLNLRRRLSRARNGDFVIANQEDIGMLQFTNNAGIQLASAEKKEIRAELAAAFLMNASAQRDAERVTAYEFRKMIEEIESVLGGVYSTLSNDIQHSRLNRLILQMKAQKKLPDWPEGLVEVAILTGMEALGREKDVERVATGLQFVQTLPPEVLIYLKWTDLLGKAFNGLGLPDVVRTDDEVARIQQQQAMAEALARGAANGEPVPAGQTPPNQETQ